jgi:hypothetical protein
MAIARIPKVRYVLSMASSRLYRSNLTCPTIRAKTPRLKTSHHFQNFLGPFFILAS